MFGHKGGTVLRGYRRRAGQRKGQGREGGEFCGVGGFSAGNGNSHRSSLGTGDPACPGRNGTLSNGTDQYCAYCSPTASGVSVRLSGPGSGQAHASSYAQDGL